MAVTFLDEAQEPSPLPGVHGQFSKFAFWDVRDYTDAVFYRAPHKGRPKLELPSCI